MTAWQTARIGPAPELVVDHAGAGPLVLFMHGIGGDRSNWHNQLPVFAKEFHAVAWDARGFGESGHYEGVLELDDVAADIVRVLDYFGARKAHVVGLSMGGMMAQVFYAKRPDRVATLVLADTFAGYDNPEAAKAMVEGRKQPFREGKTMKDVGVAGAKMLLGPNAPKHVFDAIAEGMGAVDKEMYLAAAEGMSRFNGVPLLEKIEVPTLVITGEHDKPVPPERARGMAAQIPDARCEVIADAGHVSNMEQPEVFNRLVLDFLRPHRDLAA